MVRSVGKLFDKIAPGVARSIGWETLLAGISFPASILLNRAMGAEQRGLLALTMLVPTTLFTLGNCQWDRIARGLITSRALSSSEAWRRTVAYAWPLSLVFVPSGVVGSMVYTGLPDEARLYSALYCLNFPVYFLGGTLQTIFLAAGGLDKQYWTRLTMQLSYLLLLGGVLVLGIASVPTLVTVYFITHGVSLAAALRLRGDVLTGAVEANKASLSPLWRALPPLVGEAIGTRAEMWAFSLFGTVIGVGHYSGLSALMLPVGLVSNAMLSSSIASLDWTSASAVRRYLLRSAAALVSLWIVVTVAAALAGPWLLGALLGKSFTGGEWMIPWIAAAVVGQSMANQFHTSLQLSGMASTFLAVQSGDAALRLGVVLSGGYFFSERGILWGLLASALIKTCWSGFALFQNLSTFVVPGAPNARP